MFSGNHMLECVCVCVCVCVCEEEIIRWDRLSESSSMKHQLYLWMKHQLYLWMEHHQWSANSFYEWSTNSINESINQRSTINEAPTLPITEAPSTSQHQCNTINEAPALSTTETPSPKHQLYLCMKHQLYLWIQNHQRSTNSIYQNHWITNSIHAWIPPLALSLSLSEKPVSLVTHSPSLSPPPSLSFSLTLSRSFSLTH